MERKNTLLASYAYTRHGVLELGVAHRIDPGRGGVVGTKMQKVVAALENRTAKLQDGELGVPPE